MYAFYYWMPITEYILMYRLLCKSESSIQCTTGSGWKQTTKSKNT